MTEKLVVELRDEAATEQFGVDVSLALRAGDLVTLTGDLGAGKTVFARSLIRAAADDAFLEVPSPTFTLVQSYENLPFGTLAHMDLYRLVDPQELEELGIDEALVTGAVLVEWPQKGDLDDSQSSLSISFLARSDDSRQCTITGMSANLERLKRSFEIRAFLDGCGYEKAKRRFLIGDASTRSYETIDGRGAASKILMNAPAQPDGPPICDGKPYSQIAHLAENMSAFWGVQKILDNAGCTVPEIYAADLPKGLLLIENLGDDGVLDDNRAPRHERYEAAIEMLAALHTKGTNSSAILPDNKVHTVPPYDHNAMAIEVDLLPQWYAPHIIGNQLTKMAYDTFTTIWSNLIEKLKAAEKTLVLRDFHSPNIIWCGDKTGVQRIGLIDFQDAVWGPSAYDVASLTLDARVDISAPLENRLLDYYCALRRETNEFDEKSFRTAYAIMGAQRVTKILGIFVRLSKRDGKHGYLAHLPRMEDYLARTLQHPALLSLKEWVERELPKDRLH